jgi:hypothetical protein
MYLHMAWIAHSVRVKSVNIWIFGTPVDQMVTLLFSSL